MNGDERNDRIGSAMLEEIAGWIDAPPDATREALLESEEALAAEFAALREMRDALGALPAVRPPLGDWDVLEARLLSEGLVQRPSSGMPLQVGLRFTSGWMRAAGAVLLFVSGLGVGTLRAGNAPPPSADSAGALLQGAATYLRVAEGALTVEEAEEAVRLTERPYFAALSRHRELMGRTSGEDADPALRLAAIEAVVLASQAAVRQSPEDPFLNGVLVSAMAEREVSRKELRDEEGEVWF